jgi:hypothetical protein
MFSSVNTSACQGEDETTILNNAASHRTVKFGSFESTKKWLKYE